MKRAIEVWLLINNAITREGLRRILSAAGFAVCDFSDQLNATARSDETQAIQIMLASGIMSTALSEQCAAARKINPHVKLVLLAERFSYRDVELAFGCGVDGYLLKDIGCESLIKSLRLVAMGEKVLPSELASNLVVGSDETGGSAWLEDAAAAGLSDRELGTLRYMVLGYANKLISRKLEITEATVKVHVKAVLRKLGVGNRTQAAVWAIKRGFKDDAIIEQ